ncbi:ABC transporter substrate-binding protein [Paenibacillus radicis (ex Xue et al. 2023)]|uniref:Extracellular solute-binding protein n=1 Tax=Paenibacillus radicis (ex Xue et al. 2023) TaxID=2972489 RepID=A0ABT1YTS2_9BACL|nr:extracellular solute-binding protein [Paenibacillus radicis (ex Xue et al. 2023)]MCR8636587.1 extracellular solute-binding protein [Paenibacillus radicis (ex Xue et al. 2023)]
MKRMEPEQWEKQLAGTPIRPGEGGFSKQLMRKIKERVEVRERPRNRTWLRVGPALAFCMLLLVFGLSEKEQLSVWLGQLSKPVTPIALEPIDKVKETTLKVAYFHENTFMTRYGKAYTIRYPNIEIKVIPVGDNGWNDRTNKAMVLEMMEKEKPDVLYLPTFLYGELAKEGRLYPLDAVMKQDNYDLQNQNPGVTDMLRKLGDGKLYGLTPEYDMNAIYYNKDLFDKYGVPYPVNGMSWESLLQLAARFPTGGTGSDRVYGLMPYYYSEASGLAELIAKTNGLSMINAKGDQATLNTDAWKKAWSLAIDGYAKGYMYQPQPRPQGNMMMDEVYKRNPFISGTAAIALGGYSLSKDLEMAKTQYKMPSFNWDIVSEPVNPARPDESASITPGPVYAVNAQSDQQRAAWEMVKLINSEEMARKLSRTLGGGGLSTRFQSIKPNDGHNYAPFYSMKPPETNAESSIHPRILGKFKEAYSPVAAQQAKAVIEGRMKLDEMLKQLQDEAQQALYSALLSSSN